MPTVTKRHYVHERDYERVGRFLVRTWGKGSVHRNWPQPRWEYMHYHPLIENVDQAAIGVWEADGEIVAVVHPEHGPGWAYFEIEPGHEALRPEMLDHAEQHFARLKDGLHGLIAFVIEGDEPFEALLAERGYTLTEFDEPMSRLPIPDPFPAIELPEGFRIQSLAEDNDLAKVDRLLYRGFGHGQAPPDDSGIAERRFMQSAPSYRLDLNLVVVAPEGHFVAYCGMWVEPEHRLAYVEPVATDPDYRRMGLGRAAVLEGVRRCAALGATVAWVGSDLPFYQSMGFERAYRCRVWRREWP